MTRLLMCPPTYFNVQYIINPWMVDHVDKTHSVTAHQQWEALHEALRPLFEIELVTPQKGLPDFVFTANAALVKGKKAVLTRFRRLERRGEEPFFKSWFLAHDYSVLELPPSVYFEGEGDALFHFDHSLIWLGYGIRSHFQAAEYLEDYFQVPVISLELTNESYYHLDTCFCPLPDGYLLYYPKAFTQTTQALIHQIVPEKKQIRVSEEDVRQFACNALVVPASLTVEKPIVFLNGASNTLCERLESLNFRVIIQPVSEFMKAGGAIKCLVLTL